jgi:hypothetical protein
MRRTRVSPIAGGRLLQAVLERMANDAGGTNLMCDTDSMAIVASEHGGGDIFNSHQDKMSTLFRSCRIV